MSRKQMAQTAFAACVSIWTLMAAINYHQEKKVLESFNFASKCVQLAATSLAEYENAGCKQLEK